MSIEPVATPAVPSMGRLGQATAIEASRAVAEVHAAILVAQQCPRSVQNAIAEMRASCQQPGLAERAFFRFSRGGSTVSGPSVHLARELARCWGNVQYGLAELRRDDDHGQSEMQAFAWDVQTNSRNSSIFIVPHKRDVKGGPKALTDMRDIYENNANNGARRVREAIFAILPPWFVEEAKALCDKTLKEGGGKSLAQRIADAIKAFEAVGITVDQIERKLERVSSKWTEHDVAQLHVIYTSLSRGEVSRDDEFPPVRVTAADIVRPDASQSEPAAQPQPPATAESQPAQPPVPPEAQRENGVPTGPTKAQLTKLHASLDNCGVKTREEKLEVVSALVRRKVASSAALSLDEARALLDSLDKVSKSDNPAAALDLLLANTEPAEA